jgi:hypothetical protein
MPVPQRASLPPRSRIQLRRAHLCLEVRDETIYWASARASRRGLEPVAWGGLARDPSLSLREQISALRAHGPGLEQRCEAGLRAAGALHERVLLPPLSQAEAGAVARRRAGALAARMSPSACTAWLRSAGGGDSTLWLAGVEEAESERCREGWLEHGVVLDRLQSRHLALGQLTRCLPPLAEGEVVAIFDIEPETGTCVLADRNGWLFGREVPLRFMGRSVVARQEPAPPAAEPEPTTGEPSGIELARETRHDAEEDELDPLEDIALQAERLATELRRTFRYVEGQLGCAPVARVVLAGEITELIDLRPGLREHLGLPVEILAASADRDGEGRPIGGAAVVLGMACAPHASGGNLLAEPVRRELSERRTRRWLLRWLVASSALLLISGVATLLYDGALTRRLAALEAAWETAAPERARIAANRRAGERSRALEDALVAFDAPLPRPSALLRALAHALPDEAVLQRLRLTPDEDGVALALTVEAGGPTVAAAARSVSDLVGHLTAAPFLRIDRVEREDSAAAAPAAGDVRIRFRLEGRLASIEACGEERAP